MYRACTWLCVLGLLTSLGCLVTQGSVGQEPLLSSACVNGNHLSCVGRYLFFKPQLLLRLFLLLLLHIVHARQLSTHTPVDILRTVHKLQGISVWSCGNEGGSCPPHPNQPCMEQSVFWHGEPALPMHAVCNMMSHVRARMLCMHVCAPLCCNHVHKPVAIRDWIDSHVRMVRDWMTATVDGICSCVRKAS